MNLTVLSRETFNMNDNIEDDEENVKTEEDDDEVYPKISMSRIP